MDYKNHSQGLARNAHKVSPKTSHSSLKSSSTMLKALNPGSGSGDPGPGPGPGPGPALGWFFFWEGDFRLGANKEKGKLS